MTLLAPEEARPRFTGTMNSFRIIFSIFLNGIR